MELAASSRIKFPHAWLHLWYIVSFSGGAEGLGDMRARRPFWLASLVCGAVLFLMVTAATHPRITPGLQSRLDSVYGGVESMGSVPCLSFWSAMQRLGRTPLFEKKKLSGRRF